MDCTSSSFTFTAAAVETTATGLVVSRGHGGVSGAYYIAAGSSSSNYSAITTKTSSTDDVTIFEGTFIFDSAADDEECDNLTVNSGVTVKAGDGAGTPYDFWVRTLFTNNGTYTQDSDYPGYIQSGGNPFTAGNRLDTLNKMGTWLDEPNRMWGQ